MIEEHGYSEQPKNIDFPYSRKTNEFLQDYIGF